VTYGYGRRYFDPEPGPIFRSAKLPGGQANQNWAFESQAFSRRWTLRVQQKNAQARANMICSTPMRRRAFWGVNLSRRFKIPHLLRHAFVFCRSNSTISDSPLEAAQIALLRAWKKARAIMNTNTQ
jgi:hypothetical protein